jgi:energy-coupling factor transporter ATP-binding protein EcfA2
VASPRAACAAAVGAAEHERLTCRGRRGSARRVRRRPGPRRRRPRGRSRHHARRPGPQRGRQDHARAGAHHARAADGRAGDGGRVRRARRCRPRPTQHRRDRSVRRPRRVPDRTREPRADRSAQRSRDVCAQRADALVERLDLADLADRRVGQMSGGSRRRIDLAASLVASPSVLFLDEPTTGLDPTARAALWDVVAELTATGTTVVLTTQYLEEADRLADQIVVLDHGRRSRPAAPLPSSSSWSAARWSPPRSPPITSTGSPNGPISSVPRSPGSSPPRSVSATPTTPPSWSPASPLPHRRRRPRDHLAEPRRRLRPPDPHRSHLMITTPHTSRLTSRRRVTAGEQLAALVARNLRTTGRVPQLLMFSLTMPMAMLVLFSQVFRSVADGPGLPSGGELHRLPHPGHARGHHRDGRHERRRRRCDRPHQRPPRPLRHAPDATRPPRRGAHRQRDRVRRAARRDPPRRRHAAGVPVPRRSSTSPPACSCSSSSPAR